MSTNRIQPTPVGMKGPSTWDELYNQCEMTYSGGHSGDMLEAYRHGMHTLCNVLNAHYPSPTKCAAAPELLEALQEAVACGIIPVSSAKDGGANKYARQVQVADMCRAAIAKATGQTA